MIHHPPLNGASIPHLARSRQQPPQAITNKKEALDTLRAFLRTPGIHCTGNASGVLADYQGTGAGLADRLIRADLLNHTDSLVSFDKDFCRLPGIHAL